MEFIGTLGMVTSKVGKRHALTGFEALTELFISRFVCCQSLPFHLSSSVTMT